MREELVRTGLLIGEEGIERLQKAHVAVFGVGGVGGYVVEALARSGVGAFDLIDSDTVALSNLNRQIIATHRTVGQYKVDVMKERILSINPEANVNAHRCFYLPETADAFDFTKYSYVVDAVDTVTAKLEIIMRAKEAGVPVISSMGAGNKLDPTKFVVTDIYKTTICPLARVMRRELKKRGVKDLKVVYSTEEALKPKVLPEGSEIVGAAGTSEIIGGNSQKVVNGEIAGGNSQKAAAGSTSEATGSAQTMIQKRATPGSVAFVPSVAGLILAGEVVKDIVGDAY